MQEKFRFIQSYDNIDSYSTGAIMFFTVFKAHASRCPSRMALDSAQSRVCFLTEVNNGCDL